MIKTLFAQFNCIVLRLVGCLVAIALCCVCVGCTDSAQRHGHAKQDKPDNKLEIVRFGMLPYGDHTYAIIGVKKGWFKEVGIDLQYQAIQVEDVIPYLKNGTLDAASLPPGILYSSYENAPEMVSFVFGDLFQGYTIMGQPGRHYQSCDDLAKRGDSPADRVKNVTAQLRGKTFAYPAETAIKPFIDLVLSKGGLTKNDVKNLVLDDPLTINAMRSKQADFQVGGAPSRIILEREGFVPLLNSLDIAATATASPESPELASVLEDSWVTTKQYYKEHHDTILRLASVNFRIIRFMNDEPKQALALHMPYLSQLTGQKFSEADGMIIYKRLDPFYTFEAQHSWFHNPQDLCFYRNVNGSILNNFIRQNIYRKKPPTVEDVVWCQRVYDEMEKLKQQSQANFSSIDRKQLVKLEGGCDQFRKAQDFFDNYDYLDAKLISDRLLERLAKKNSGT